MTSLALFTRNAVEADRAFIFNTYAQTLRTHVEWAWGWDDAQQEQRFWQQFELLGFQMVLTAPNQAVGAMYVEQLADRHHIRTVFLQTNWQGHGWGSELISGAICQAHACNKPVTLRVIKTNPAKRLYERLGFKAIHEDSATFAMVCPPPL